MPASLSAKPSRSTAVQAQHLPDNSAILLDTTTGTAHPITESAVRIWNLCDGHHTLSAIVDDLFAHYEIDQATVEADTLKLVEDFANKNLLKLDRSPEA